MHQLGSLLINQNVLDVSVTQAYDVADWGHKTEKLAGNSLAESKTGEVKRLRTEHPATVLSVPIEEVATLRV